MKIYTGYRDLDEDRCDVRVDGVPLNPRLDLLRLSPAGFEWGYRGRAAGQLALAILADAIGDEALALECYEKFRDRAVAGFGGEWMMTEEMIRVWATAVLGRPLPAAPAPELAPEGCAS